MIKKIVLFFLPIFLLSCTSKTEKLQSQKEKLRNTSAAAFNTEYIIPEKNNFEQKLSSFVSSLPLEVQISQLFIENLEGNKKFRSFETYDKVTGKKSDSDIPLVAGGYLFFSFNLCETAEQQNQFMNSISEYCELNGQIKPFLAIDQEGGWVNRLKKLTGGLPSQEKVALDMTVEQAFQLYSDQAEKMKNLGFTMNLAPVIEICTDENKDFLDGRSFGDYEKVCKYGIACVNGYENNGISTVIKHFPGNTNTDPHVGLPVIDLPYDELIHSLESFETVIKYDPSAVLMSHAITTAVDNGTPACLSKIWITEILRNKYKYEGIVFSDDIFMGALSKNGYPPEKAAVMAIDAGIDCIMISEKRFASSAKILYQKAMEDDEFARKIQKAAERIIRYKIQNNLMEI